MITLVLVLRHTVEMRSIAKNVALIEVTHFHFAYQW